MQQTTSPAAALIASSTGLAAGVAPPDTYIPTYLPVVPRPSPKRECRLLPSNEQHGQVQRPILIQEVGKRRSLSQRVRRWLRRNNVRYEDEQDGRWLLQ
ncbi:hypothetical protein AURDEDRAFT_157340 [Auricularia subglabra TFB-10046 SS5]|nr:hypothetical protein AURDEDRAFT_157340 [Auricularia subglabra TFB-10046 SS5]